MVLFSAMDESMPAIMLKNGEALQKAMYDRYKSDVDVIVMKLVILHYLGRCSRPVISHLITLM